MLPGTHHLSYIRIAHQSFVLRDFSMGEMFQSRQFLFSPSEWASEIAELRSTPLPIIDVSGRPEMFSRTAVTVDIPGDTFNSEYSAWPAWFQMYRRSGQRWSVGKEFRQYTNDWAYRQESSAGDILSFSAAYCTLNVRSSRSGKHRCTLAKYLGRPVSHPDRGVVRSMVFIHVYQLIAVGFYELLHNLAS